MQQVSKGLKVCRLWKIHNSEASNCKLSQQVCRLFTENSLTSPKKTNVKTVFSSASRSRYYVTEASNFKPSQQVLRLFTKNLLPSQNKTNVDIVSFKPLHCRYFVTEEDAEIKKSKLNFNKKIDQTKVQLSFINEQYECDFEMMRNIHNLLDELSDLFTREITRIKDDHKEKMNNYRIFVTLIEFRCVIESIIKLLWTEAAKKLFEEKKKISTMEKVKYIFTSEHPVFETEEIKNVKEQLKLKGIEPNVFYLTLNYIFKIISNNIAHNLKVDTKSTTAEIYENIRKFSRKNYPYLYNVIDAVKDLKKTLFE